MRKPEIKKLKAEWKKLNQLGNPMPEFHSLVIVEEYDDEEEEFTSYDVDFHGSTTDWCAIRLGNFTEFETWKAADWKNKKLRYCVENRHGTIDEDEMEPWFLDEDRKIIFFKKVD